MQLHVFVHGTNTNRKLHMPFPVVSKLLAVNNRERPYQRIKSSSLSLSSLSSSSSLPAQSLPFQQILPTLILLRPWTAFMTTGTDQTDASRFIFSSFSLIFQFVRCDGLSWLHVSSLVYVKYTISYRIVLTKLAM